jgi:hypothetical protein
MGTYGVDEYGKDVSSKISEFKANIKALQEKKASSQVMREIAIRHLKYHLQDLEKIQAQWERRRSTGVKKFLGGVALEFLDDHLRKRQIGFELNKRLGKRR